MPELCPPWNMLQQRGFKRPRRQQGRTMMLSTPATVVRLSPSRQNMVPKAKPMRMVTTARVTLYSSARDRGQAVMVSAFQNPTGVLARAMKSPSQEAVLIHAFQQASSAWPAAGTGPHPYCAAIPPGARL